MATREVIFPAGRQDIHTSPTYSAVMRSGDLLFVSGQVGSRSDGSPERILRRRSVWHSPISRHPCKREAAGLRMSSM